MIPTQTLSAFPEFGNSSTKVKPDDTKYSAGFVNADVVPYEWVNYLHNKASVGITDLNSGVSSMEKELNAVVTAGGATPSESSNNQVLNAINYLIAQAKSEAILAAHPIGSLYWSSKDTDPNLLFGGTWTRIKDKFILAAGDTYTAGATGGSASAQLTVSNLPSHSHSFTPSGSVSVSSHTHGLNGHTHSFTPSGSITMSAHSHSLNNHTHSFSATATTGNQSANPSFGWTGSHSHTYYVASASAGGSGSIEIGRGYYTTKTYISMTSASTSLTVSGGTTGNHTHSVTVSGTTNASIGNTNVVTTAGSFTGTASITDGNSGNTTATAPTGSFTGSAGITGATGDSTSFSILPPYLVKYCWERTA